ncbi:MAG: hypothetical protein QM518_07840 [Verrucomicrobiota bacterium]|jgi:hypothetical protein|nr:hypothetical protein [Verrucomicrobiota bacterium]
MNCKSRWELLVSTGLIVEKKGTDVLAIIYTVQVLLKRVVVSPLGALGVLAVQFPCLHA